MPRLLELFCGTKSIGRAFEAAGWEVVSLDIVSKFEPMILCDIRSWDYALFPPGHFDMVWASPVCTEYSRALTMRPRRLEEGDALVLRALEIMAHFDPLMWVIENRSLGGRYLLQVRDSVQEADPAVDQHALEAEPRAVQERQPVRCVGDGRHLRSAQGGPSTHGGPAREGQGAVARAALQHSYGAVRGDCERGHGRACGSAEHPGLKRGAFLIRFFYDPNELIFFPSRHALRRRPISRPTWHSATARRLRLHTLGRTCS